MSRPRGKPFLITRSNMREAIYNCLPHFAVNQEDIDRITKGVMKLVLQERRENETLRYRERTFVDTLLDGNI